MAELPGQVTGRVVNLRPKQVVRWQARAPLRRRGSYLLGPTRAFGTDFFGIFRFQRNFPGTQEIIVYPGIVDLPNFQLPQAEWNQLGSPRRRSHEVTPSASSVREYTQGDSLKRIHWPSSVRTGKLMVKDRRPYSPSGSTTSSTVRSSCAPLSSWCGSLEATPPESGSGAPRSSVESRARACRPSPESGLGSVVQRSKMPSARSSSPRPALPGTASESPLRFPTGRQRVRGPVSTTAPTSRADTAR